MPTRLAPDCLIATLPDAAATAALANCLAPMLAAGDCILLSGDIGAGKTHFARAAISARLATVGRSEDIPSPTFTIVQTYEAGDTDIWHADLYRLSGPDDIWELGLDQAFDSAVCLVEWPDRLGDHAPDDALRLQFDTLPDDRRRLTATAGGPRARRLLARLATCHAGLGHD
jgi:tRNA threonylcarbamoyladenosine biosynthesis protein TsaE